MKRKKKEMMISNLSQKDKEKAEEIIRLFSQLSAEAKPKVLGHLTTSGSGGDREMEVKL